ncbi:hypothetical protein SAMN04488009_2494 [Maribacter sedimenticola]|uniref:PH domain-containing protein n=1 Tax=Maribacter sedimenticola TaxID=228956 RepID=A0ABY1SIR5_9FLAO|nr:hypothetical protein [Maribacter sedimenticola]SNR56914.1 hypothetical protein SAMN04488009_2494 [Maribacter sedimenticola]
MAFIVLKGVRKKNVIISEGNRPLWHLIIAAIHYTAIVSLLLFYIVDFKPSLIKGIHTLKIILFILPGALTFSIVKDVLFDLQNKRYKLQYGVGPIRYGIWKELPEIEYVSVFKQPLVDGNFIYEANLWYAKNRHFNVYESESKQQAYLFGENIAKILEIDLLDATEPNNYTWKEVK